MSTAATLNHLTTFLNGRWVLLVAVSTLLLCVGLMAQFIPEALGILQQPMRGMMLDNAPWIIILGLLVGLFNVFMAYVSER